MVRFRKLQRVNRRRKSRVFRAFDFIELSRVSSLKNFQKIFQAAGSASQQERRSPGDKEDRTKAGHEPRTNATFETELFDEAHDEQHAREGKTK